MHQSDCWRNSKDYKSGIYNCIYFVKIWNTELDFAIKSWE